MKNLTVSFLLTILILGCASAQEQNDTRKGRFHFNIGPEYRITPFYKVADVFASENTYLGFTNIDAQNAGPALNVGVEYFVFKNLALGFTNAFRYESVIVDTQNVIPENGIMDADYRILMDYHLYLAYYFKLGKSQFFINAGLSLINTNSAFGTKVTNYIPINGEVQPVQGYTVSNFEYTANRITVGYEKNNTKIFMGIHTTQLTEYFPTTTRFNVPFMGCSFNLGKL